MPKHVLTSEPPMPPPGRASRRALLNLAEHRCDRLARHRTAVGDFAAHPPHTKPIDPANFGAEDLARRAVGGNVAKLGIEHVTTLDSLASLARMQHRQGRHIEAEPWARRALAGFRVEIGPCHPSTLEIAALLVAIVEAQLDSAAEPENAVHGDAVQMRHVPTPTAPKLLLRDAVALRTEMAQALEEQLGPEHDDTLAAVFALCATLRRAGLEAAADELEATNRAVAGAKASHQPPPLSLFQPSERAPRMPPQLPRPEKEAAAIGQSEENGS